VSPIRRAAIVAAALVLLPGIVRAQSYDDMRHARPPQAQALAPAFIEPDASSNPVIYVTDINGELATITLGSYALKRIGYEGTVLTDLGFDPKNGDLYGISFTDFYKINVKTGAATHIGSLGINDANALVFDANGKAYVEGYEFAELYTLSVESGRVSPIGGTSPFRSAGDLSFYNGELVLSGYYQSSLGNNPDTLVALNASTGKPLAYAKLDISNIYGLVSTGKNLLFGFANESVYEIFPSESVESKRTVLLKNLSGKGIGQIMGAAYDGYFQT
jgi:hypothetical protein